MKFTIGGPACKDNSAVVVKPIMPPLAKQLGSVPINIGYISVIYQEMRWKRLDIVIA